MSASLMDTEPGGESTQYESIDTVEKGHAKQGGQLGNVETQEATSGEQLKSDSGKGEMAAENIRYGQSISEEGVGGQTTGGIGEASSGSGDGGTEADQNTENVGDHDRKAQGYGPGGGIKGQPIGA